MNNNPWSNPANPSGPKPDMFDKLLDFAKNNLILSIGAGFLLASGGLYLIANHFIIIAAGLVLIGLINLIKPKTINFWKWIKDSWEEFEWEDHPVILVLAVSSLLLFIVFGCGFTAHIIDLNNAKKESAAKVENLAKQEIAGKIVDIQYYSDYQVIKTDLGGLLVSYPFSAAVGAKVTIKYWERADGKKSKSISLNDAENGVYLKNEH